MANKTNTRLPLVVRGFIPRVDTLGLKYDAPTTFAPIRNAIVFGKSTGQYPNGQPFVMLRLGWGRRTEDGVNKRYIFRAYVRGVRALEVLDAMGIHRGDLVHIKVAVRQGQYGLQGGQILPARALTDASGKETGEMGQPVAVGRVFTLDGMPAIEKYGHVNLPESLYDHDVPSAEQENNIEEPTDEEFPQAA